MVKYQWVRQQSGEDCAAASLAIVLKHYGRTIRINRIREAIGTAIGGTNLLGLKQGAENLGFVVKVYKATPESLDNLDTITLPAIIYWKGYHFVVLYGREKEKFVLSDPGMGIRYLSREELLAGWQGCLIILLKPHPLLFPFLKEDKASPWKSWVKRFYAERFRLVILLFLNLILSILIVAVPVLTQQLVDSLQLAQFNSQITIIFLYFGILSILESSFNSLKSTLLTALQRRLQAGLKSDFGEQLLRLPLLYFEARGYGTVQRRLWDIDSINAVATNLLTNLPLKTLCGIGAATVLLFYHPFLLLGSMAIACLFASTIMLFYPHLKQATYRNWEASGENFFLLSQIFANALTVKITASATYLEQELQKKLNHEIESFSQNDKINNFYTGVINLLTGLGNLALLGIGTVLFWQNQLTLGKLIAINSLAAIILDTTRHWVDLILDFSRVQVTTQKLDEMFEIKPESQDGSKPLISLFPTDNLISQNLHFHYPGRLTLLENFSATVPGGKVTAIIGHSGCGKSTLAKLITRLYPLEKGEIYLGHHNFQDLPLEDWRRQVVLVPQESRFLTRSIADNLRLAAPNATLEDVIAACEIAVAHEFVTLFPEGYDTILGDFSANLSDGQKQRLAIARAILMNPPVLILDEATANLDPPTEARVLDRLLAHRQGKTTILISHRPRVIARADWIVLMAAGMLKFQGEIANFRLQGDTHLEFLSP